MDLARPKVALLRGAYFGPFEAQNFEPLLDRFDIQAYVLPQNPFDLRSTRIPVNVCRFPDSVADRSVINAIRSRVLGQKYPMPNVDAIVRASSIVHTFEAWYAYTSQASVSCKKHGVPMVVTHWDTKPYPDHLRDRLLATYAAAPKILAPSSRARDALLAMGVQDKKIIRLGMGVDARIFCPGPRDPALMKELGFDESDFVFLFAGRLAPEKGLNVLVEAFAEFLRHGRRRVCRLLLIGDGPEGGRLRRLCAGLDLESSTSFVPSVSYGEIHRWHRLADAFVYPSLAVGTAEEQFGYSLVEAMSTGVAVIATEVGGMPDVIGDAGTLIPQNDPKALAAAMSRLFEDAAFRETSGQAARKRAVESLSTATVSAKLGRIYDELIRGTT